LPRSTRSRRRGAPTFCGKNCARWLTGLCGRSSPFSGLFCGRAPRAPEMLRILSYPGHGPQRRDWLADDAVGCELVSAPNSLLTGRLTGNFANSGPQQRFPHLINELIQRLAANSLRNGTGNSCSPNREFFRDNREFNRASSEGAELLSGRRISPALDVNSFGTSAA